MKTVKPFKYLVERIEKKRKELEKLTEEQFGKYAYPDLDFDFALDSASALGICKSRQGSDGVYYTISLNAALLNELKDEYINEVFVHEFAHAVVGENYTRDFFNPIKPHGKEFKFVCSLFGIVGRATTKIATNSKAMKQSGNKQGRVSYSCDCGHDHQVSTRMHNSIKRGRGRKCSLCKSTIYQVKKNSKVMA